MNTERKVHDAEGTNIARVRQLADGRLAISLGAGAWQETMLTQEEAVRFASILLSLTSEV